MTKYVFQHKYMVVTGMPSGENRADRKQKKRYVCLKKEKKVSLFVHMEYTLKKKG